ATGGIPSDHLFFAAPWILLPLAIAIGSIEIQWARLTLAATLLIAGGIGWSGIYARRYYAAPQFIEPWAQVAAETAPKVRTGATVISNDGPFFLYLTYALRSPTAANGTVLEGLLPDWIHDSHVMSANEWNSSDHSRAPVMIWVYGSDHPATEAAMDSAAKNLDQNCGSRTSRLMDRDPGFAWKQRFLPRMAQAQWLIEIREYDCSSTNSREVFPIPPR
ncbi:MAG: hypothetical protein ACRD4Y_11740, partial [Candidatus Acidiferrales bacterium]